MARSKQPTPRALPARPSLTYLKKLAKDRLDELRQGSPDARLAHAQLAVAREHGFTSWRALKAHLDRLPDAPAEAPPKAAPKPTGKPKRSDWKPIMDAALAGDAAKVRQCLNEGADPNVLSPTNHRHRPLHRAIEHKKTMPKHDGHEAVVALLLQRGADPRLEGTHASATALQLSAEGEPRFVPLLLPALTPLDIFDAALVLDLKRVRALLKRDPSLATATNEVGRTPLHCCAASKLYVVDEKNARAQLQIAALLMEHGADASGVWLYSGSWPIPVLYHAAGQHDNPALTAMLMDAGADPCDNESVYHAADEGHEGCLALFDERVDPEKLAAEATMALRTQLHWGKTRGAKWLLAHGADPNSPYPDTGRSALQAAAHHGSNAKVIAMLLAHGGDPAWRNAKGETAIELARAAGKTRVVQQLEAHAAR